MSAGTRVLFVEDNEFLAEATAEFLKLSGLEVWTAATGEEALQVAQGFRPDIVLCDLSLPDMSGLEVLRALRSSSDANDAVLAVHTALGEFDLRIIEREADVRIDVFLTKPLTREKLLNLLKALRNKRQAAPPFVQ